MRYCVLLAGLATICGPLSESVVYGAMPYRVREGDSLWLVARRHDTTVKELCRLNDLDPDKPLHLHQQLSVPGAAAAASHSAPTGKHRYVSEPFVNVRKAPGTESARVALARLGTPCRVVRAKDPWVQVRFGNGVQGWVRQDLLKEGSGPSPSRPVKLGSGEKGYVAGTVVNVRSGPGTSFDKVTQSRHGATLWILERTGGWMQVRFGNGVTGWVAQELVKLGQKLGYAYVKGEVLNLRAGPAARYGKVGQLTQSQKVTVYKRKGDWLRVQCCSGQFGWVADWLVKEVPLASSSTSGAHPGSSAWSGDSRSRGGGTGSGGRSGSFSNLIATALRYRGIRYSFGSASPRRGFDCSGFVSYVLGKHGVSVPRSAREQYGRGRSVSRSALRQGDLVFFKNTYRAGISHVGLYAGNGRFIHASSSRGVRLTNLGDPYYRNRYAGAKRVL
ncbi:MAG: hypothetical protein COZ06_37910 [Armatimonadetes bacterium CG_4_10_14_3_um_filter_66_18]|nr:MAG: hypothetical protein AUJ96_07035 [Armatimonadetes bacterium CG2_30_66_41]PIY35623.1 MAG: hypothetical protein COZ06_37910 [Armatimonadetes bacterium CG_4_10_14_3_um_filter_66_18]PIZ43205.1 MAG: hypothetical protein COY42_16185 [Armatimonadetes bacterium CG_4_10_14_0_8_um_filter_66_14]